MWGWLGVRDMEAFFARCVFLYLYWVKVCLTNVLRMQSDDWNANYNFCGLKIIITQSFDVYITKTRQYLVQNFRSIIYWYNAQVYVSVKFTKYQLR